MQQEPLREDLHWRKSGRSGRTGNCVELAAAPEAAVAMRHSRDPLGPVLLFSTAQIAEFLDGIKAGEFDGLLDPGSPATFGETESSEAPGRE